MHSEQSPQFFCGVSERTQNRIQDSLNFEILRLYGTI